MSDPALALAVENLKKYFPVKSKGFLGRKRLLKAVDDVSFTIAKGETYGLVGESGCGKSTVARTILRLYEPNGGSIRIDGTDIAPMDEKMLLRYRRDIQMIFQDPFASLNPIMTVRMIVEEPLKVHFNLSEAQRREMVVESLAMVGLGKDLINRYPHEFSGGQRQRIGIARALVCNPKLVLCDEPISALDVSIQSQVVNMLRELQEKNGWAYLFITHDLKMVKYISRKIGVMYLGKLVETAESGELYANPLHPYTQGLIKAIPLPDPAAARKKMKISIEGEIPSPLDPPSGCYFHPRCPRCRGICMESMPEMKDAGGGHFVSCHLY